MSGMNYEDAISMKKVAALVSLGCAKNLVDSEMMAPQLMDLGYAMAADPSQASLIVVNTCGFIQSAVEEAIETILDLAALKTAGSCRMLVVCGCMVQRYGKKLISLLPEVDALVGTSHCHRLGEIVQAKLRGDSTRLWIDIPRQLFTGHSPRVRSTPFYTAYLKIADGCSNHCTYCFIPKLRGAYRSRELQDVVEEASQLAAQGLKEINLVAQDITAFGMDHGSPGALEALLELLDDLDGIEWIRLLYAYPDRVTDSLLHSLARAKKLVPYLDIPFQHCVPHLLQAMRRHSKPANPYAVLDLIRSLMPDITLRTSLMVGFPGETEADFAELLQFVERAQFDHAGVFAYSPEAGTRAARMPGQVADAVKAQRRHLLLERQQEISRRRLQRWVGQTVPVLVEGFHPETQLLLSGRMASQAPEVDGTVIITSGCAEPGQVLPAKVTQAHDYDVEAQLVEPDTDDQGQSDATVCSSAGQ